MITVLYFASVREQLNCSSEQIEYSSDTLTVSDLKNTLAKRGSNWSELFTKNDLIFASVNQVIVKNNDAINDSDEVAFFPQVTGG